MPKKKKKVNQSSVPSGAKIPELFKAAEGLVDEEVVRWLIAARDSGESVLHLSAITGESERFVSKLTRPQKFTVTPAEGFNLRIYTAIDGKPSVPHFIREAIVEYIAKKGLLNKAAVSLEKIFKADELAMFTESGNVTT